MRKILSIPLFILILFSGITVNFSTHYCGGSVAATKVSLNGELATCGMESKNDNKSKENRYTNHCCEDVTASYSLSCNYIPSFHFDNNLFQQINFALEIPAHNTVQDILNIYSYETIRPPGTYTPNSVDRQVLCVFLI
jgi:sporulation-control protein spo0M